MKIQYSISGESPRCECVDSVRIENKEYLVNASFDKVLRVFDLLKDKDVTSHVRIEAALTILIVNDIEHMNINEKSALIDSLMVYFSNNRVEKQNVDLQGNPLPDEKQEEVYRINHDGDLIYSAFMQAYGIDLIDVQGKLHWFKFCSLLKSLPRNTKFSEICGYRSYKKPSKNDTYEKQMMKLKEVYALPNEDEEEV